MSIELGLYSLLTNAAGLTALLATPTSVYPNVLPEGALCPAITYERVSAEREYALNNGPAGLARPRFQIKCWGQNGPQGDGQGYADANALAEAVRQLMATQDWATWPYVGGSITVQAVTLTDDKDAFDDFERYFHHDSEYEIWHAE